MRTGVKKVVIRECNEGGPHHQVGGSQSGQPRSTVPTVMYLISLAHLVEEGLDEQGWRSAFSSIKLTHPLLVNTLPLTTTTTNPIRDRCKLYLSPYFSPLHVFIPTLESTPTSTPPHAACRRAGTSSTTRQSWTLSEQPYRKCTRHSWTDGHIPTYHLTFFLYIGFVSIVNNLTLHWCTWDHPACMCIGTPRRVHFWTDGHVPMCCCWVGLFASYFGFHTIYVLLYCSACVAIYVFHSVCKNMYILFLFI